MDGDTKTSKTSESPAVDTRSGITPGSGRRLVIMMALVASLLVSDARGETLALAVLLVLILLHEAGHYSVARVCGMRVHEFFVGFGPLVWSYNRKGIEYGIKALPLGGYVRIAGMTAGDLDHPEGYQRAGRWRKIAVVAAGPATNLAIALGVAFSTLFFVGLPSSSTTVDRIDPRLGAAEAGLRPGDKIVEINGASIAEWNQVGRNVEAVGAGGSLEVTVERGDRRYRYSVPVLSDAGQARIGVGAKTVYETLGFFDSAEGSVKAVGNIAKASTLGIINLVQGLPEFFGGLLGNEVAPENRPISPIGAVQIGAQLGGESLFDALELIMVYSTFLAVFNLFPILPLDGGRIAVILYETAVSAIRRRKVEVKAETMAHVGLAFTVALLMVGIVALILDIAQPVLQ